MKMVAASKLRRAQEAAESSQPYARAMAGMISRVANGVQGDTGPALLVGTGADKRHLLVVISSDRGLCGGFNSNLVRYVRHEIRRLSGDGKDISILCVGRKARDVLRREFSPLMLESLPVQAGKKSVGFSDAQNVSNVILDMFDRGAFDVCSLVYNQFVSVLAQRPSVQQLIPFVVAANANDPVESAPYSFEPDEETILSDLLPKNISVQIFRALLDSAAGEQAARMTAMDNATRNAGDMIKTLSIKYNRARQAYITKELIEIISGAEAV